MKAVVYYGAYDVRVTEVPDAKIEMPTDVLVNDMGWLVQTVAPGAIVKAATGELSKQTFWVIVSLQVPVISLMITWMKPWFPLPHVITAGLPVNEAGVPPVIVQL